MLIQDISSSVKVETHRHTAAQAASTSSEGDLLTIGDISRHYNVSLRALRFYEERQLLQPIRRGTARLYDAATRARLEVILKGKQLGFTLTEIRDMLETGDDPAHDVKLAMGADQVVEQIAMLERQRAEIDSAITELRATHERLAMADAPAPMRQMA